MTKRTTSNARLLATLIGVATLVILGTATIYAAPAVIYQGRIFPGIQLLSLNLGGKTVSEAKAILTRQIGSSNFAPFPNT